MVETQTFAYLRVSKLDQDLEKNKRDILKLANNEHLGHVHFVEEKVSGKISWRKRQIADILEKTQPGDTIIVSELSRLGRRGNWRLDGSIQSKIIAMAFAIAAEIERDLISQRTTEALRARKQQGKPLGRPKWVGKSKLDDHRTEIEAGMRPLRTGKGRRRNVWAGREGLLPLHLDALTAQELYARPSMRPPAPVRATRRGAEPTTSGCSSTLTRRGLAVALPCH